jgi:hypothetical protein
MVKLQRGATLEATMQAAVDEWQQLANELGKTVEGQGLRISDAISEHLVGVVVDKRTTVLNAKCRCAMISGTCMQYILPIIEKNK